jgi:hypothetical protein
MGDGSTGDRWTGARLAVLHTSVHTTHYSDQSPDIWDGSAPAWVRCEHFDESTFGPLIEGLAAGYFHGLALASASLQSSANRRAVTSDRFAAAFSAALRHGLGLIVLQEYIGIGQRLRFPGLAPAIDGELVDHRDRISCADIDTTRITGLDPAAAARTRDVLLRGASRANGLSPTEEGGDRTDAHRARTVFSGWSPRLRSSWRVLLEYPGPDGDLIALGYSESVGNRIFVSSLPLDRWGAEDLLREAISRAVRPRGLLVIETTAHELAQDGVLGGLHDSHLAAGGFVHRTTHPEESGRLASRFGHLLEVGRPLDISTAALVRIHRSRLEHGGSVTGRLDAADGPVIRLAGIPEHLEVARDAERHLVRRLSDPRLLLTFEFLALARLARALQQSVSDPALVPLGLRPESLAMRLERPLRERIDAEGTVDGFVLPTAAAAASLHLLAQRRDDVARPNGSEPREGVIHPQRMIEWALGTGAPELTSDHQFAYLADLIGESVDLDVASAAGGAAGGGDPFWSRLLRIRREGVRDLEVLESLIEDADAPALLAYVVLDALDALDRVADDDTLRREVLSRLRRAGSALRRHLARAMSADHDTVETVALAAAATVRLIAAGDPVIGWSADGALSQDEGRVDEREGRAADESHHRLVEQQRIMFDALERAEERRAREVDGLLAQRARLLPFVRAGLIGLAVLGVGVLAGLLWVGSTVIGLSRDGLASSAVGLVAVMSAALWNRRRIGALSPFTLLRRRRSIEAELDDDAMGAAPSRGIDADRVRATGSAVARRERADVLPRG